MAEYELDDDPGLALGDGAVDGDDTLDAAELNQDRHQYAQDGYDPRAARRRDAQKRIDRLVYERNIERDTNKRIQAELAETRRLVEELRQKDQAQAQTDAQSQRAALLAKKREALDLGNSDDVIRLDEELFELTARQYQAPATRQQQPPRQEQQRQEQQPPVSRAALAWLERNTWANDPRNKARYDAANRVYQEMVSNERFDPDDDFTFQELDYRIRNQAPPNIGGGVDRGNLGGRANGPGITAEDKAKMRGWGLDPDNADERKAWLKSKAQTRGGDRGGY